MHEHVFIISEFWIQDCHLRMITRKIYRPMRKSRDLISGEQMVNKRSVAVTKCPIIEFLCALKGVYHRVTPPIAR